MENHEAQFDLVSNPRHYVGKTLQVIDVIEALRCGAHMGNVIKYILRAPHKGNIQDLNKAIWYLRRAAMREIGPLRTEAGKPYSYDTIKDEFEVSDHIAKAYVAVVIALGLGDDFLVRRTWLESAIASIEDEIACLSTCSGGAG